MIFSRDSALGLNWSWIRSGLSARYKQSLFSGARIIAGAELEYQKGTQSDYSPAYARQRVAAYGQLHLDLSHDLMISGGLRLQNLDNRASISIGAAAVLRVAQSWTLRVDLSQSARLPSVVEGWGLEQERSTFAYADLGFNTTQTNASILAYTRIVTNPIVASAALVDTNKRTLTLSYRNADKRIVSGLLLRASHRFSNFRAEGNAQLSSATLDGQADKSLPAAYVQASFRYEAAIAKNLVYLGLAAHAQSSMQPNAFVPMEWAQVPGTIAQSAQFGGIDVLAGADLGDATIKVRYQNILSNSFSSLSIFPNPVRNLSISVAWTFFD